MKKILSLLLTILLIVSSMCAVFVFDTAAASPGDLIINGDFETDTGYTADGISNRFPSPLYANPAWTSFDMFHKWFRASGGNATINSRIITDPDNENNKIARVMQTALQGVQISAGRTYVLTFSAKADYAFQQFDISFQDLTNAVSNGNLLNLYPVTAVSGTKTYDNGGTQVTEELPSSIYYAVGTRARLSLQTDKWVTYTLNITVGSPASSTALCALRFGATDYSGTTGDPANVPYYLDNVSLTDSLVITTMVEDVGGKVGGYITTPSSILAGAGQEITISAVPYPGNTFVGWYVNDVLVSTDADYTFAATTTATYVAKFSNTNLVYIPPSTITPDDIIAQSGDLMVSYPHYGTPAFTEPGQTINAEIRAPGSYGTSGWIAWVENEFTSWPCTVGTVTYGANNVYLNTKGGYIIPVTLPHDVTPELLTLVVKHTSTGLTLRSPMSVSVIPELETSFYTAGVTDTHFGWNKENTIDGNNSPTAWGLMCKALTLTGARYISHTGDISLYPLMSRDTAIKEGVIGRQLQYSGYRLPLIITSGNHEYDTWVYPGPAFDQPGTTPDPLAHYYDANGNGVKDPGEFDGANKFDFATHDRFFGQRNAIMMMGSFAIAKHDMGGYMGDPALRDAFVTKWNALTGEKYRLLMEHTHKGTGLPLFDTPLANPYPTPYPNLEIKGHDHGWGVNQTTPYRVLSQGGGDTWTGGSGHIMTFNYNNGTWSSPQETSWSSANKVVFIKDARLDSPQTKIRDTYVNDNTDGTATSNTCTITNEVNYNFYDGRVRFVMSPGRNYVITGGEKLSQYTSADGTKTVVLARVNIPASSSVSIAISEDSNPVETYTVTFDSQGGSAVDAKTVVQNTAITAPNVPTKTGFTFDGWYTESIGGTKVTFPYTVTANTTLYAHWTEATAPTSYTVTFDSQGGSAVAPQTVEENTAIASPANPVKIGSTFNGWYTAASGGTKVSFPYTVTGNVTLYAQWVVVSSNLLVNGDFETDTGFTADGISNRFPTPLTTPVWTADKYYQWFRASGGNKDIHSKIITDPSNPQNKIASAMQTAIQGVTVEGNKTYTIKFNAKADYAFQKFNIIFVDLSTASTSPVYKTLIPITSAIGTKTYDNNGTPVVENITPYDAVGTRILLPLETDKWATYEITFTLGEAVQQDKLCGIQFRCDDYTGSLGDPTLVPFYMDDVSLELDTTPPVEEATVTFDSQGGSAVDSQTVDKNTAITAPAAPTKAGFTFDGWYTAATGGDKVTFPYTVTADVTFYAHWTPVSAHTPGDINGDDVVDLKDVTTLSRYIAGWTGLSIVEDALDVNNDGTVDLKDVTLLSRFIAGWNVQIF